MFDHILKHDDRPASIADILIFSHGNPSRTHNHIPSVPHPALVLVSIAGNGHQWTKIAKEADMEGRAQILHIKH
jgi:hypothetical protein